MGIEAAQLNRHFVNKEHFDPCLEFVNPLLLFKHLVFQVVDFLEVTLGNLHQLCCHSELLFTLCVSADKKSRIEPAFRYCPQEYSINRRQKFESERCSSSAAC